MNSSNPPTKLFQYAYADFLAKRRLREYVDSKLFDGGKELEGQWALRVSGREQIRVQLYWVPEEAKGMNLLRPVNPYKLQVAANFQIMMIDAGGKVYKTVEGSTSDLCVHTTSFLPFPNWGFNLCSVEDILRNHENLLPGGQLLLRCCIWAEQSNQSNFLHLSNDFGKLFHEGTGSDFTVVVSDSNNNVQKIPYEIPAHKVILGARSQVFAAMFSHAVSENEKGVVHIIDFDFEVVYAMLKYMYTETVDENLLATRAADLLQIADKYILDGLCERCEKTLVNQLDVENAGSLFILAHYIKRCSLLKEKAGYFLRNQSKTKIIQTEFVKTLTEEDLKLILNLFDE